MIINEKQNNYAYQLMCFMDILKGYENWQNKLGKKYLNSKIESSEELFECLGLFISDCNNNDKNLDQPRYSWWQDFCFYNLKN